MLWITSAAFPTKNRGLDGQQQDTELSHLYRTKSANGHQEVADAATPVSADGDADKSQLAMVDGFCIGPAEQRTTFPPVEHA